jgi:hypothetical protein
VRRRSGGIGGDMVSNLMQSTYSWYVGVVLGIVSGLILGAIARSSRRRRALIVVFVVVVGLVLCLAPAAVDAIQRHFSAHKPELNILAEVGNLRGSRDWAAGIFAKDGEQVSHLITVHVAGTREATHVMITVELSPQERYVPKSGTLINGNFEFGYVYPTLTPNGNSLTIGIGDYNPHSSAYFTFKTILHAGNAPIGTVFRAIARVRADGLDWKRGAPSAVSLSV